MSFVPPISRDGFCYNGDLYVLVGDLNRHKRASIPEITSILHPVLDKAKATAPGPFKDPVGHWYTAQLVRYGLPVSKTKAVAKTRLLDALNSGTLAVPAHLLRFQADLKKEWASLERKAKAAYKAELGAGGGRGMKRKGAEMEVGNSTRALSATKKIKKMPATVRQRQPVSEATVP